MLVVSLDESGSFEDNENNDRLQGQLIGGALLQTANEEAYKKEQNRLADFLREICTSHNGRYPMDLHWDRDGSNRKTVERIKNELFKQLPNFLQKSPNGKYGLYALIRMRQDSSTHALEKASNLIKEDIASNRYEHMANHVLENLLFYDKAHAEEVNKLRLAVRSYPLEVGTTEQAEEKRREYEHLGYSFAARQTKDGHIYVKITSSGSFRVALTQMTMQNSWHCGIQVDLQANSMNYYEEPTRDGEVFLYLADILCSKYRKALIDKDCSTAEDALQSLEAVGFQLLGNDNSSFWCYNDVDIAYRKAFVHCQEDDFFNCLREIYLAQALSGSEYYWRKWYPQLEKIMRSRLSPETLRHAIEKLRGELMGTDYSLSMCQFIFDQLRALTLPYEKASREVGLLYMLYSVEMTIANHCGKYEQAQEVYKKACRFAKYVSVEEYLELRNLYAVSLTDGRMPEQALEFTKETLQLEKELVDLREKVIPGAPSGTLHEGRSESQLGQCYAFCGKWKEAAEHFERALSIFETSSPGDRQRTLSYYLHSLIEQAGARDVYERYAEEYFGSKDYTEQPELLKALDSTSRRFALYVYIKALFVYYRKSVNKSFVISILNWIDSDDCAPQRERRMHPWEIIYKYCAALCVIIEDDKRAAKYQEAATEWLDDTYELLGAIVKNGNDELSTLKKSRKKLFFDGEPFIYMYR